MINSIKNTIPEDWEERKLGDKEVCELIMGQSPSSDTYNLEGKGIPFFQGKKEFGSVSPTINVYCSSPKKIARPGDILMSVRAPVGPTNVANVECCIGRGLAAIRPNLNLILKNYLLYYFKNFEAEISNKGKGSTFSAITKKALEECVIPIPPLEEQKRIVSKIDALFAELDKATSLIEESLKQVENLLPSVLNGIFRKGKAEGWEEKKLGEVCDVIGGGTPKTKISEYWDGEIVWLSPTDLPPIGEISSVSDSRKKITDAGLNKSSAKLLPKGSVIYSTRASIGKIAIAEIPLSTNQGFTNFICREGLSNHYLCYCLKHFNKMIENLSNSTTFKEVSKSAMKEFEIPVPSIDKQNLIVNSANDVLLKSKQTQSKLESQLIWLKQLKSSVLNKAFKGEL